jgi:hypothetical protein
LARISVDHDNRHKVIRAFDGIVGYESNDMRYAFLKTKTLADTRDVVVSPNNLTMLIVGSEKRDFWCLFHNVRCVVNKEWPL